MLEVEATDKENLTVPKQRWNQGQGGWDVDEKGVRFWRTK